MDFSIINLLVNSIRYEAKEQVTTFDIKCEIHEDEQKTPSYCQDRGSEN